MHRTRDDRGQTSAEYAGVLGFVSAVVAALVLLGPPLGLYVGQGIRAMLCKIIGSSCPLDVPFVPTKPCVLGSEEASAAVGVTAFSVKVGDKLSYTKARRSDGTWAVTLKMGGELGAEFKLGASAEVEGGPIDFKQGLSANASLVAKGDGAQTYVFASEEEANRLIDWAKREAATSALGPAGMFGNWLYEQLSGDDYSPPDPEETYITGGFKGSVDVSAGAGPAYAKGSAAAERVLGIKINHKDGTRTVFVKVGLEGNGSAGISLGPGGSASGGVDGVMSLTFDRDGNLITMSVDGSGKAGGGIQVSALGDNLDSVLKYVKTFGFSAGEEEGQMWEVKASLDLRDPANREAVMDFLTSSGLGVALGMPTIPGPSDVEAARRLYERFSQDATVTFATYDTSKSTYGASGSAGLGVKFGANGKLEFVDATLTDASYRIPGVGFVPWTGCK